MEERSLELQTSDLTSRGGEAVRLLLVDDDEEYAFLVRMMLDEAETTAGWRLDWEPDPQQADTSLRGGRYHACIVDQHLGGQTLGTELIRNVHGAVDTSFIVLTSDESRNLDQEALVSGASQFLEKSRLTVSTLERVVRFAISSMSRARRSARRDDLTGLESRRGARAGFDRAQARARSEGAGMALLLVDLDGFKAVNDHQGHAAGDELLRLVSGQLTQIVRPHDIVGRIGGDEFVVVLTHVRSNDDVVGIADRVVEAVRTAARLHGHETKVTASVGATRVNDNASFEQAMDSADIAMYAAKRQGKDRVVFSGPTVEAALGPPRTRTEIERAAEQGDLVLFYQPIIDLRTGSLAGAEALVRWGPGGRWTSTEKVIEDMERNGSILELDSWVLRTSPRLVASLGLSHVSINISPVSASEPSFAEALGRVSLADMTVDLELTERQPTYDLEQSARFIDQAQESGCRVFLDDFGCGHSSLSRLRRLPVDGIKIDRSFVTDLRPEASREKSLVRGLASLGQDLGLEVIVEGVETAEQAGIIGELGISLGQGYWFARPMRSADLRIRIAQAAGAF